MTWKRTYYFVWASQFLSIMGFSFALPFAPYYIQELGVTDPVKLKFWVAAFAAATAVSLAVFSPVWGWLADRYGRRLMLLRANLAGWMVLTLMGFARNVEELVLLRLLQGIFTGTMTAAQALVAGHVPEHRSGYALGTLSAAVYSGSLIGSAAGGVCAHVFGYRISFVLSGLMLLAAALLVGLGATEGKRIAYHPVETAARSGTARGIGPALPILALLIAMGFVRQFDAPYLPLLVQEIHGSLDGAALWSGLLISLSGIAGMLAGIFLGRMADRVSPPSLAKLSTLGAALLVAPQAFAVGFPLLFTLRFGSIFCSGGLEPVFQIWLSRVTPAHRQGFVFGWAGTARSIGWMLSPFCAAFIAARFEVRAVFLAAAALYLAILPLTALVARRAQPNPG